MADSKPNTPPPSEPSAAQMKRVLIPAVAIGVVIVLVAVLVSVFETNPDGDKGSKGKKGPDGKVTYPAPTGGTDVSKLSDGSAPSAEDADLKDLGAGLKYRDLKVGDGAEVKSGDTVTAYYTGWLTNGTVFDSARQRGEPIPFSLREVVKGWGQGIPGMKVGGIRKLVIPAELGYGSRGSPPKIPPGATLIFEVEIVDVK